MEKTYMVDFDIKANRTQTHYTEYITARTLKEAREKFDEWWRNKSTRHAFHVEVRVKKG